MIRVCHNCGVHYQDNRSVNEFKTALSLERTPLESGLPKDGDVQLARLFCGVECALVSAIDASKEP